MRPSFQDSGLANLESEQHVPWIYALRFLRVAHAMQMCNSQETLVAISQLKVIAMLANNHGDSAVSATASAIEALIHVNRSNSSESIEQAQRALAAARSSQLNPLAQRIPQITMMAHFVDISCSIYPDDPEQAGQKLRALQSTLDMPSEDSHHLSDDGCFLVPLAPATARTLQGAGSSGGVVRLDGEGSLCVQVNWLPRDEIYTLGFILSAVVNVHRNASDGRKAEQYLREAMSEYLQPRR